MTAAAMLRRLPRRQYITKAILTNIRGPRANHLKVRTDRERVGGWLGLARWEGRKPVSEWSVGRAGRSQGKEGPIRKREREGQ